MEAYFMLRWYWVVDGEHSVNLVVEYEQTNVELLDVNPAAIVHITLPKGLQK